MSSSKENGRISYIDIAKGIAIICVILGHFCIFEIDRVVYTFHIPIFFLISGYFINNKLKITDFIKEKAKHLLIPYYITCLVIILIALCFAFFNGNIIDTFIYWFKATLYAAGSSHSKPLNINSIGAIWFLWALFWSSIFLRISLEMKKYMRMIFIGTIFAFGYFTRNAFWLPLSIQPGACSVLFMYIGYLIKINKNRIDKISPTIRIVGSLTALIITFMFIKNFKSFHLVECDLGRGIIDVIGCLCACWVVILISQFIDKHTNYLKNFFTNVGHHTLIILCVHIVEINLLTCCVTSSLISLKNLPLFILMVIEKISLNLLITRFIVTIIKKKNFKN